MNRSRSPSQPFSTFAHRQASQEVCLLFVLLSVITACAGTRDIDGPGAAESQKRLCSYWQLQETGPAGYTNYVVPMLAVRPDENGVPRPTLGAPTPTWPQPDQPTADEEASPIPPGKGVRPPSWTEWVMGVSSNEKGEKAETNAGP